MKTRIILAVFTLLSVMLVAQNSPYNAVGDTLTVIQSPLLNIPAIHIPGEQMPIICLAPANTTNWYVELVHGNKQIALPINNVDYLSNPNRWQITVTIPQLPVFELYDLRLTASGGVSDITRNAVKVLPSRKTSYYFVHVTDTHMPGRIFYPDAGYAADSTSVNDFREVARDINLIQPEFVLLTGDLVNEGELEGFAGMYQYGWAQRMLEELEVPVYLTAGNHDIGGWNSTPPPAGTARRNWWKYFGWKWLDNPDSTWPRHTQDYSFTYGNLHFIGLEAYDNYDNWRANIYGGQSYIYSQINWLNSELSLHPDKDKVLFHHYDFSDQLNLNTLGISMSLWGHIHSNSGSLTTFPYDLSTRSTCDNNRAYRVIRVNNGQLQPLSSIYAGYSGTNINITFSPANNATADSIRAFLTNSNSQSFDNCLIKFNMPAGDDQYLVTNGILEQIDRSGAFNVVYVRANLPANGSLTVSISKCGTDACDPDLQSPAYLFSSVFPNPFRDKLSFIFSGNTREKIRITIFNQRGAVVQSIDCTGNAYVWDGFDKSGSPSPAGLYFIRAERGGQSETKRVVRY